MLRGTPVQLLGMVSNDLNIQSCGLNLDKKINKGVSITNR
jgi:hypothetical protein